MWFTLSVIALCFVLLSVSRWPPDIILAAALSMLLLANVVTPEQALAGLANPGLATVAVLYVVVAALVDTGAVFAAASLQRKPV